MSAIIDNQIAFEIIGDVTGKSDFTLDVDDIAIIVKKGQRVISRDEIIERIAGMLTDVEIKEQE